MKETSYSLEIRNHLQAISENRGKDPQKILDACDALEKFGTSKKDDYLLGYAYFSRGETYYLLNDANNFYNQMLIAIVHLEKAEEWAYVAVANMMLGIMSLNRGNAPYALDYYIKSITICQDKKLPDVEWMVHMNLGALYLNIEEYQKSLDHTESSFNYLITHPQQENYIEYLTTAYLSMAKAYLALDQESMVLDIAQKIKTECYPYLTDMDRIVVYCFFAILHQYLGEAAERDRWVLKVNDGIKKGLPIMDVFDDFYDYLQMLLNVEKYDDFFEIYNILDDFTKKTTIKNLEKKLLTLKIRYFRRTGQIEEYKLSSVLFYELSEFMERENRAMVSNMIVMRNSYNELTVINKRVERENSALQKKSETDPLTGMFNRFKLNEYGEEAFKNAIAEKKPFAVEILDIDYFKQYNDNYGHQAGDMCIKFIADKLLSLSEDPRIFTARYGGDEFVIMYEGISEEETLAKAKGLRASIVESAYEHKFSLAADIVTISQGICWGKPEEGQTTFDYLHKADEMLYEVKKESRNSIRLGKGNL